MSSNSSSNDQVIPLTIKWGKEVIDHELIPSAGVKGFKNELEIKTNVPVDRMKLMAKSKGLWKGILKDDFDLTSIDWNAALQKIGGGPQNGGGSSGKLQCLLMGSAAKMTGPREKTVFLEDLPPEEVAKVQEPSGLVNLGNTCYLNSVVQCLRAVPPLRKALTDFTPAPPTTTATNAATTAANAAAAQQQRQRSVLLVHALRDTYRTLDRQTAAVQPMALVQASRMAFPQFAQRGPHGQPMQQDAEEFYSAVMAALAGEFNLDGPHPSANIQTALAASASSDGGAGTGGSVTVSPEELGGAKNLIDAVFGMKMKETLTCDENTVTKDTATKDDKEKGDKNKTDKNKTDKSDNDKKDTNDDKMEVDKATDAKAAATSAPDADAALAAAASVAVEEPPVVSYDLHRKLVCNIQGGSDATAAVNVSHVSQGIALSLEGKIEKRSEALGRDAVWTRRQRMARCPPVLVVQFGRFYWKATPDSMDHAGVKCKVMKPVAFPAVLDVYDFCVPEIQSALKVRRDAVAAAEEDAINRKLKGEVDDAAKKEGDEKNKTEKDDDKMDTTDDDAKKSGEEKAQEEEDVDEEDAAALQAALAMSLEPSEEPAVPVGPGLPSTFMGMYDLFAVVTHKGRDADGGHYMAWVKSNSQPDKVPKIKDSSVDNEEWFVFDDDEVSSCKTEDILKLSGGGDWHMSYLNFYKAKK